MMYLGSNPVGITQKDFLCHGTYAPSTDTTVFNLNTESTEWKHFLLTVKSLPYANTPIRAIALIYINITGDYEICVFGASSGQGYPANLNTRKLGTYFSVNNGVITKTGIAAESGKFIANTEYEWWCW